MLVSSDFFRQFSGRNLPVFLFLMLVSLVLANGIHAQFLPVADDVRVARMGYSNTSGEEGVSIHHYRRDGVLDSAVWMLLDKSRYSANFHIYDERGLMVEKYREFSDGLTSIETFIYDDLGHRLKETFQRSDGVAGSAQFQWGEDGLLLAANCDKFKGWFTGLISYEHDNDRVSAASISRGEKKIGVIRYHYDDAGHLVSETWDFDGQWEQTFSYEYEPVPAKVFSASSPLMMMNSAYRVSGEDYDFNSKGGGPSQYSYDDAGRLEKKIFERADGLRTETSYVFDDKGDLVSSHRSYHDGRTADFSYSYDEALRLTGKTFRQSTGEEGFETYTYDRLGRLDKAIYWNMDFWLNGVITFFYDDWGHLDAGTFAGEDGYDADLQIETDSHGNVLLVHWVFSTGMTQTYRFKYDSVQLNGSVSPPSA